jgi:thioredoxin reductase (NADPH)
MIDVLIVGGGPSGLTAALYSLRAGKSVMLLEKEAFGGQIATSPKVENFPSIKEISGLEFSDHLFQQVIDLGAQFDIDEVEKIDKNGAIFNVKTTFSNYEAKSVIIASGVKHRKIGVAREDELIGKGISYCAVCDGAFYKGKDVVLIGDANTALQYTILLSSYCNKVYLNTLFDKFFADDILVKQLPKLSNVVARHNLSLKKILGKDKFEGLIFEDTKTKEEVEYDVPGCFIAIGQIPDNERYAKLVELNKGFIITDENMVTKTDGLFACGDCRDKKIRQLTTACNDGSIAAISACQYIDRISNS